MPVHAQPEPALQQTRQVAEIGRVVAVPDAHPVGVDTLVLEHVRLLLADSLRRPRVGHDGRRRPHGGASRRSKHALLTRCDPTPVAGALDDARLDAGIVYSLGDFARVEVGDPVDGNVLEQVRHVEPRARRHDDVHSRPCRRLGLKPHVAGLIVRRDVDDGVHSPSFCVGQIANRPLKRGVSVEELGDHRRAAEPDAHVLMTQGESEVCGIDGPPRGLDCRHSGPPSKSGDRNVSPCFRWRQ